jgi:hypothetical protein
MALATAGLRNRFSTFGHDDPCLCWKPHFWSARPREARPKTALVVGVISCLLLTTGVAPASRAPLDLSGARVDGIRMGDTLLQVKAHLGDRSGRWTAQGDQAACTDTETGMTVSFREGRVYQVWWGLLLDMGHGAVVKKGDSEADALKRLGDPDEVTPIPNGTSYAYRREGMLLDVIVSSSRTVVSLSLRVANLPRQR